MPSFPIKPCATDVTFNPEMMDIELADGRHLQIPLAYFPRLLAASPSEREDYVISGGGSGLHWEGIDEDILVDNLLLGIFDHNMPNSSAA